MSDDRSASVAWPLRAPLLLCLGALAGLACHFLLKGEQPWQWADSPPRTAAAAFVAIGFLAFAFSLERLRWSWSSAFAVAVGTVVGLVTWTNGPYGHWGTNERWQLFSAMLAIVVAVPLFQTVRDLGRARIDYPDLHANAWTNILLWCAAWAFVLLSFLLLQLLAALFDLIGIHLLRELVRKPWFGWTLVGGTLGAAVGLLRERDRVLVLLQRVVTAIVSVLAPVLAAGLVLFVLALPFTGLEPLWEQTKQTTPILLSCILGAFVLVNATIGSGTEEGRRAAVLRHSALALAVVMLPLGIVAAVSLGKRIGQYGLTPDRLWAAVFVFVALAAGLLYLGAVLRRRLAWAEDARRANILLALGVSGLALFLALPILSFGAISASDQVARLQSGKVSPDQFDWVALRFDFGPAGERASQRLTREAKAAQARALAARILARKTRFEASGVQYAAQQAARPRIVTVIPRAAPVPQGINAILFRESESWGERGLCARRGRCLLSWQPGQTLAVAMLDSCAPDPREPGNRTKLGAGCAVDTLLLELNAGTWREVPVLGTWTPQSLADAKAQRRAIESGAIEVRQVTARRIYVGGRPVGSLVETAQPPK